MNIFEWFRGEKKKPETENEDESDGGYFSTEITNDSKARIKIRAHRVWQGIASSIQAAMPRAASTTSKDGYVTAMDSLCDSPGDNALKSAYALSQPNISEVLLLWYVSQSFIGHQMCAILSTHWLIDKCCSMPAEDALRQGYQLVSGDGKEFSPEQLKQIEQCDEDFRIMHHLNDHLRKGRIFGIRIAYFKIETNDPEYYEKPFNIDGITPNSYQGIVQMDPYWTAPILDQESAAQPDSMHFYEPTWWLINGKRYHRTHLIIFLNGEIVDFLKPSYLYGGVPVPQRIMERIYAAERTANEGPLLAMTKRTTGMGTNTKMAYANKEKFDQRMAEWMALRDNNQVKIYDKTTDELVQFDTSLADLDAVIMTQYQIVAAASGCPATKLLGTTPKGFNATGEFEESSYHEMLETLQTHSATPLLLRHHKILSKSHFGGKLNIRGVWNPLDSPTAQEEAQINLTKAQTGLALVQSGAIDGYDERDRVRKDKKSGYTGIPEAVREDEENDSDDTDNSAE